MRGRSTFHRRAILIVVLLTTIFTSALTSPAQADETSAPVPSHASEVSVFYYPWYATPDHDGHWSHWEQNGRTPPESLGASFYPLNGLYSSTDTGTIEAQMQQIAAAGIDTVVSSWWGQGSYEDSALAIIVQAAKSVNLNVAVHIEPYKGRNDRSLQKDVLYLRSKGIRDFYIYQTQNISPAVIRSIADAFGDDRFFGETANQSSVRNGTFIQWASDAHFNGIYTYDPRGFTPIDFGSICERARAAHLLCLPSIGPGWDATRATKIPGVVNRDDGSTYDRYWQGAIDAHADIITITSYNEWHEGTQIEPAIARCIPAENYCYSDYEGAYGKYGIQGSYAYLNRTLDWTTVAKGKSLTLSERLDIVSNAMRRNDNNVLPLFKALQVRKS